ncbi:MAG: DUF190 domain-containing protein [Sedimentisphaerales bacterium]|nr:DUF190 domain-containing protein [Sedimentisphaerales bacterium]
MRALEGEQICMRIFIGESDRAGKGPLYRELLNLLRTEGIAGATVLRGIAGYGAKSHLHTAGVLALSQDLPILIEAVDTQEHMDRVLPKIDAMVDEGLITLEKVHVLRYAPKQK